MIARYTREEMGQIWSEENKFAAMMEVECCVAEAQSSQGIIPKAAALKIRKKAQFQISRILEIEKTTKHDVVAFVSNLAENVGPEGRYIHFAMTSSDILDTAMSVRIKQAGTVLLSSFKGLKQELKKQITKHKKTLCAGRTHGMHADITSFGHKLAGFYWELERNQERFASAYKNCLVGKLSGVVGTYALQDAKVEKKVCHKLGLQPETLATQVIPRDRHAELLNALALTGSFIERLCVELRHSQRTEVGEVLEGFSPGQKGSSAMPHKKNPISSENLTGIARMLRSYASAGLENVALWHERDISHSSVERVFFSDAFILCDYALHRMSGVIKSLYVDKLRMLQNIEISQGQMFSSHILLEIVKQGPSREEAYSWLQECSHSLKPGQHLAQALAQHKKITKYLPEKVLNEIFSGSLHQKNISKRLTALGF